MRRELVQALLAPCPDILTSIRRMEPHGEALGSLGALRHLATAAQETSDSAYLRRQYEDQGSTEGMVNAAIRRFRGQR